MTNIFLSKADVRKLVLIHTIEENFQQKVSISDLKERMNVSGFVFSNMCEELKQDIEMHKIADQIYLQRSNQNIKVKKNIGFSTEVLKNIYVKNSLCFQIIQDVFEENFTNSVEYAKLSYTCRTKFYKKLSHVKKKLEGLGIKISSQFHLVGDEVAIRIYISNLYMRVYGNDNYPFSTILKMKILCFIEEIEKKTDVYLTQTSKVKLLYFVSVCQLRMDNKNTTKMKLTTEIYSMKESLAKLIKESYIHSFNEKINDLELKLLLQFTESLDEFPFNAEPREADFLTRFFVREFQNYFGEIKDKDLKNQLIRDLMEINYPILVFKYLQTELDIPIQTKFMKENYPEIITFFECLMIRVSKSKKLDLINKNYIYLSNCYIFLLINIFHPSFFSPPIKICVDFKLGKNYNQFICRNIKTSDFINIELKNELTSDIDILLCDYIVTSIHDELKVIVWNVPPTSGDWANLGRCISKSRNKKGQEKKSS